VEVSASKECEACGGPRASWGLPRMADAGLPGHDGMVRIRNASFSSCTCTLWGWARVRLRHSAFARQVRWCASCGERRPGAADLLTQTCEVRPKSTLNSFS
jgi:hypothetical protein